MKRARRAGVANREVGSRGRRGFAVYGGGDVSLRTIRRKAIENAVIAVATRKGLEALTVQDVAIELGVAKGTLYLYFNSRAEMVAETARDARRRLARELAPMFSRDSVEECLTELILHCARLSEGHRRVLNAAPEAQADGNSPDEWGWEWTRARLLRLFGRARRRNEIRHVPSAALATCVADFLEGQISRREHASRPFNHQADAATLVSVLLHGILSSRST